MPAADSLFADIFNQRANLATYVTLAEMMQQRPQEVIDAFNDRSPEDRRNILDACKRQHSLSTVLLQAWLDHVDLIDSRYIQSYLCSIIEDVTSSEVSRWQERSAALADHLSTAAGRVAEVNDVVRQHADIQRRYITSQEELDRFERLQREMQEMQAALGRLEKVDRQQLEREIIQLRTQRDQLDQEVERLRVQHRELEQEVQQLREEHRQKADEAQQQVRVERDRLRNILHSLELYAARLNNPPTLAQTSQTPSQPTEFLGEQEELRRLLVGGELRKRLDHHYQQWEERITPLNET